MDSSALKRPPRRGAKGQTVIDFLTEGIRNGRYAPGQRLVELDITSELGVSRGPVREAFRKLAAEGLVEIVPNRGALVRRLSRTDALELFQIRTELEALAARQAAIRIADPCVRDTFIQQSAAIWRELPRYSTSDYIAENQAFHSAIFEAAGNTQLIKLNYKLQLSLIMSQINSALTSEIIGSSLLEHRVIAEAILEGNARVAERTSREHMRRAAELVASMQASLFSQDEPRDVLARLQ